MKWVFWFSVALLAASPGAAMADAPLAGALQSLIRRSGEGWVPAPGQNVVTGFLFDKKVKRVTLPVDARCYRLLVSVDARAERVGASWLGASGAKLAAVAPLGTDLVLDGCPEARGLSTLELLSPDEDGAFALRLFVRAAPAPAPPAPPSASAATTDGADGGTSRKVAAPPPPPPAPPPADPMADRLDAQARLTASRAVRIGKPLRGMQTRGMNLDFTVNLDAGRCYLVNAVGSVGIDTMRLIVVDPEDRTVDEMRLAPQPVVSFCAKLGGPHRIRVIPLKGGGGIAVGLYSR